MNIIRIHKISYRFVSVFLFISVLFCSVFSSGVGVYASDSEINSLPVDINIDVNYDSDYIYMDYLDSSYTINRNTSIDLLSTGYYDDLSYSGGSALNGYYTNYYPISLESTEKGLTNASYWFSPSQMKLYVLTSSFTKANGLGSGISNSVCSYSPDSDYGFFSFSNRYSRTGGNVIISVIDLNSNTLSLGSSSGTADYKFSYYSCLDDPESKFTLYYPNDLVCIFSNYSISGFYDPDVSHVNTPDYYFDFQYIFYSEGNGYTFVDSASRLTSIDFSNGVNNARYNFEDTCNFYIYTSVDGITWVKKTSVLTMYSDYFDLKYDSNFATTYFLITTNDSFYGDPPIEWTSVDDIISSLDNIIDSDGSVLSGRGFMSIYNDLVYSHSSDFVERVYYLLLYLFAVDDIEVWVSDSGNMYPNAILSDDDRTSGHVVKYRTFFGVLIDIRSNIINTNSILKAITSSIDILNSNLLNIGVLSESFNYDFSSFSIPDYSDTLHDLEYNLTHVNDDISVEIAQLISGLPDYTDTLSGIYTVIEGIPSLLNTLFVADKLVDAIDLDSLFDSDSFDLSAVKSFVSSGISVTAVNSFSKLLDFDVHTLSGFKFINGYITKLYNVNHTFSMVCLIGAGFTTMNYVIRKSKG